MKKVLFLIMLILLLTGCGKKSVVCTMKADGEISEYIEKYEIVGYLDQLNKIKEVEVKYYFVGDYYSNLFCNLYKCENNVLIVSSNDEKNGSNEFNNLIYEIDETIGQTKEDFINYITDDSDQITCK